MLFYRVLENQNQSVNENSEEKQTNDLKRGKTRVIKCWLVVGVYLIGS